MLDHISHNGAMPKQLWKEIASMRRRLRQYLRLRPKRSDCRRRGPSQDNAGQLNHSEDRRRPDRSEEVPAHIVTNQGIEEAVRGENEGEGGDQREREMLRVWIWQFETTELGPSGRVIGENGTTLVGRIFDHVTPDQLLTRSSEIWSDWSQGDFAHVVRAISSDVRYS